MKKLIALILCTSLLLTGCGLVKSARKPMNDLEQNYTKAVKKYHKIKPRLQRDFKLLFGTDSKGNIDTGTIKVQNYPDSGVPGIQDIVYSRYQTFTKKQKEALEEANKKAIKLYHDYKEITKKLEKHGPKIGGTLDKINSLLNSRQVKEKGLTLLKEFITIAGKLYVKEAN